MSEEESTNSVSKGVFLFKNNFKRAKRSSKKPPLDTTSDLFSHHPWYEEFTELWSLLNEDYENLTADMFTSMTYSVLDFINTSHQTVVDEIPTAALLIGINMPDHEAQFRSLQRQVNAMITPHIAILKSEGCATLKCLMEGMINQFVNGNDEDSFEEKSRLKKSSLTMPLLQSWYESNGDKKLLVVIAPDFESFNVNVLQKFILIASSYLANLPFVFVFGIATSIATLHTSFPYQVTSKINIKVFKCEPSVVLLNKVLEGVFLSPFCPFQLGGKVFNLFTEIFLFYDFSVRTFVQNIKFAMMEHFYYGNAMTLCQIHKKRIKDILDDFTHEDYENVRHLMSFRKLVESEPPTERIMLLTDDNYFRKIIEINVSNLQKYIKRLHIFLKCLHSLVGDLPGAPLGKNLREIYGLAVTKPITQTAEYKEAFKLLNFQAKDELTTKLKAISDILQEYINEGSKKTQLKDFYSEINRFKTVLLDMDSLMVDIEEKPEEIMECEDARDRKALKEALLSRLKQKSKPQNRYEKLREEILTFISKHFELYLPHYSSLHLHEIFFFDDMSIKSKIVGMHRSAIHSALNNPCYYLQCNCCKISNNQSIRATMPDICIAYKLHLEYGKMINLYDWLQAFLSIVAPENDEDLDDKAKKVVNPHLQARFSQAIAELEYLGYIKKSKRKTDHVSRLTWEG